MIIDEGQRVVLISAIDERNEVISRDLRKHLGKVVTVSDIYSFDRAFKVEEFEGHISASFIDYKKTQELSQEEIICEFCKKECDTSVNFSKYTEFTMTLYEDKLSVSDDYGHEDEWEIKYCPMCGKKVKQEGQI